MHTHEQLGRGWQYTVYDMGNGRVLKRANTRSVAYMRMVRDFLWTAPWRICSMSHYFNKAREEAMTSMSVLDAHAISRAWLAFPVREGEMDYTQDKVSPLRTIFPRLSQQEGEGLIDRFVQFNRALIQFSYVDRTFQITENYGLDKDGNIVLMDLGEIAATPEAIARAIADRPWALVSTAHLLPPAFRAYFIRQMDEAFLPSALLV